MKCNICNYEGDFRSFGNPVRANAQCPKCGSLERQRFLYEKADVRGSILHFAPERCLYEKWRDLDYMGVDLYPNDIRVPVVEADITSLPFEDELFDTIICSHILEHISDDEKAISELYRVLRYKGKCYIQVPIKGDITFEDDTIKTEADRIKYFGQKDHVRYYGMDISDMLVNAGFKVVIREQPEISQSTIFECLK